MNMFRNDPKSTEVFIDLIFPKLEQEVSRFKPKGVFLIEPEIPDLIHYTKVIDSYELGEYEKALEKSYFPYIHATN